MNYIKSLKVNYSLSAVICVILGIVLLVWPCLLYTSDAADEEERV